MALQDITSPFVWGAGGARKTPEQIARDREIAAALLKQGVDFSPIASPLQGLARVANAAAGAYGDYRANQAETANAETSRDIVARMLSGAGPQQFPAAPGASVIAPDAAAVPSETPATSASPVAYSPLADGADWLSYANQGATRNQPLSGKLESALGSFLPEMGVTMKVFSGGQDAEGPRRTGSHRHDHGNAADVFFYKDGRQLSWANPDDLPIFEDIVRRGKAAGITGFGAGDGYMRPGSMHIGFGSPAVWGAGGRSSNAPDWLRQAFNSPAGQAPAAAAVNALAQGQPAQVASLDQSIGLPQAAPVPEAAPLLPEPRTIQDMPVAGIPAGQQVAQALTGPDLSHIPVTAGGNSGVYQPGQGINMQAIAEALSSPYVNDTTRSVAAALLKQQMDPNAGLDRRYREAQIRNIESEIAKRDDPNARDKFGNSVIWGQNANGDWVAMQPSSGGGLIAAQVPDGIKLSPPGASNLNLGTQFAVRDRNGNVVNTMDIDNTGKARDTAIGQQQGAQLAAAPGDIVAAQNALDLLDSIRSDPYLERGTGLSSMGNVIPGTGGYDFANKVQGAKSGAFLTAIQQMRGLGSLSDAEGKAATSAVNRMNTSTSKDEFTAALGDYEKIVRQGLQRAQDRLGGNFTSTPTGKVPEVNTNTNIPQGAIDMLRGDPSLAAQFDAKYGQGAAARAMGGQ